MLKNKIMNLFSHLKLKTAEQQTIKPIENRTKPTAQPQPAPVPPAPPAPQQLSIPEVHLTPRRTITRSQTDTRAFPLTETPQPKYDGTPESIASVLDWLDVERSKRYRAGASQTFCNIYAYDYCTILGAYLPRVWWTTEALNANDFAKITYSGTVREMNVNALYIWFQKYGVRFGWKPVELKDAQAHANNGKCVIALAANKNRSRSGHITCVVPETNTHKAARVRDVVMNALQSHAGSRNEKYMSRNWAGTTHERVLYFVKK